MFTHLGQRQGNLIEQMDIEDADCKQLEQTYADFYTLNRLISRWNRVYAKYIRPHAKKIQRQSSCASKKQSHEKVELLDIIRNA